MTENAVDPLTACIDALRGGAGVPSAATILESDCIGCTLCIQACPVDAIIGAKGHMHTVVTAWCTGCELCLAPCPVDCIRMRPVPVGRDELSSLVDQARRRYASRLSRVDRERQRKVERGAKQAAADKFDAAATRQALIAAALARARQLGTR